MVCHGFQTVIDDRLNKTCACYIVTQIDDTATVDENRVAGVLYGEGGGRVEGPVKRNKARPRPPPSAHVILLLLLFRCICQDYYVLAVLYVYLNARDVSIVSLGGAPLLSRLYLYLYIYTHTRARLHFLQVNRINRRSGTCKKTHCCYRNLEKREREREKAL